MSQYDTYQKQDSDKHPVLFKPPLTEFKPNALMSTDDSVALLDSSYKKHKNAFIFVKHGGFEEVFLANSEHDMNDWLAKLNYAATFRTAGVRMRGLIGANYEGQRRSVNRNDSTTSSMTVPSSTGEVAIHSRRIDEQLAQEIMVARRQIMTERISEADERLTNAQKELEKTLRNARHLQVLLPVQARTREQVIHAAGRMSAKLKWVRMEIWRTKCHRDILKMDLEQEGKMGASRLSQTQSPSKDNPVKPAASSSGEPSIMRLDSKAHRLVTSPKSSSTQAPRPLSEVVSDELVPTEAVATTISEPSDRVSVRRSQASLDLTSVPSQAVSELNENGLEPSHARSGHSLTHQASNISSRNTDGGSIQHSTSRLATPTRSIDNREDQLLRESGLLGVDGTPPSTQRPHTASGSDRERVGPTSLETPPGDKHKGVRRSLHRTLRDSTHGPHLPHHHRSRKGKDSNSSVAMTEDNHSLNESETLARGAGSFIVHGKKASVITFGSEWQSMSPEERLRLRKQAHAEEGTPAVHTSVDDGAESIVFGSMPGARTSSVTSASTATAKSFDERPLSRRLDDNASGAQLDGGSEAGDAPEDSLSYASSHGAEPIQYRTTGEASDDDYSHVSIPQDELKPSPQPQSVGA